MGYRPAPARDVPVAYRGTDYPPPSSRLSTFLYKHFTVSKRSFHPVLGVQENFIGTEKHHELTTKLPEVDFSPVRVVKGMLPTAVSLPGGLMFIAERAVVEVFKSSLLRLTRAAC